MLQRDEDFRSGAAVTSATITAATDISVGATDTAQLFEKVYQDGRYGDFSGEKPAAQDTVFLREFIGMVRQLSVSEAFSSPENNSEIKVLEIGPGTGAHSLKMAENGMYVTAIESSPTAASRMIARMGGLGASVEDKISVTSGNALKILPTLKTSSVDGIYANSVLHFWKGAARDAFYREARRILRPGGIIAVSYKAAGDGLQQRAKNFVGWTSSGNIFEGEDGIQRLFVSNPAPLLKEMRDSGLQTRRDPIEFQVPDYNIKGLPGLFVGIVGQKAIRNGVSQLRNVDGSVEGDEAGVSGTSASQSARANALQRTIMARTAARNGAPQPSAAV